MPKLSSNEIDELHVLVRHARLKWAEKATGDSDYALEKAVDEAEYIVMFVKAIQDNRVVPFAEGAGS